MKNTDRNKVSINRSNIMTHPSGKPQSEEIRQYNMSIQPFGTIPIIFVPGIYGSHLVDLHDNPVWIPDDVTSILVDVVPSGLLNPSIKEKKFHPNRVKVYRNGPVDEGLIQNFLDKKSAIDEKLRRGWGEVSYGFYGKFLQWLETILNDVNTNFNSTLIELLKKSNLLVPDQIPLNDKEASYTAGFYFPVHAFGYNWLQSNEDSGYALKNRINDIFDYYKKAKPAYPTLANPEAAIVITHSMGGLVARACSQILGFNASKDSKGIIGVIHGVMPAIGTPAAYHNIRAGNAKDPIDGVVSGIISDPLEGGLDSIYGGIANAALGLNAITTMPVACQSPGPLQLLPTCDYGADWLKVEYNNSNLFNLFMANTDTILSLPLTDPYKDIYLTDEWYGIINKIYMNPLKRDNVSISDDDYLHHFRTIMAQVKEFHEKISQKYHPLTYGFYGGGGTETYNNIVWANDYSSECNDPPHNDIKSYKLEDDDGYGRVMLSIIHYDKNVQIDNIVYGKPIPHTDEVGLFIKDPNGPGDGTVAEKSGKIPSDSSSIRKPFAIFTNMEHSEAYNIEKHKPASDFVVWCIGKIINEGIVLNTVPVQK